MNNLNFFYQDFATWLETLNYSRSIINHAKLTMKQLSDFLTKKEVYHPNDISAMHLHSYIHYQKWRPNLSRGGGLSAAYINKQLSILRLYQEFLQVNYSIYLPLNQTNLKVANTEAEYLTVAEVKSLYEACDMSQPIGYRDRAILSLFYGCGLRRSEGATLTIQDVKLDQRIIHVRKSKNNRERFVPIALPVFHDLKEYLLVARPVMKAEKTKQFLISEYGNAITPGAVYKRIKALVDLSTCDSIKYKDVGLHTLRHSLATHLLANGMSMERIARILGHKSTSTTQRYAHLVFP